MTFPSMSDCDRERMCGPECPVFKRGECPISKEIEDESQRQNAQED
jgi:hypothetical protein